MFFHHMHLCYFWALTRKSLIDPGPHFNTGINLFHFFWELGLHIMTDLSHSPKLPQPILLLTNN
jgi:hypothetical protein